MSSIIELRKGIMPKHDLDYLSWPLWYDQNINLPVIKKTPKKICGHGLRYIRNNFEILTKDELERTKGIYGNKPEC